MKTITFNRCDLYKDVWTTPINALAEKYGVSQHQLADALNQLNIPKPKSGHWSKVRNGIKVNQTPLPLSDITTLEIPLAIPIDKAHTTKLTTSKSIIVSDHLRKPHYLVVNTYRELKDKRADHYYKRLRSYGSGYLDVFVSPANLKRAMLIWTL